MDYRARKAYNDRTMCAALMTFQEEREITVAIVEDDVGTREGLERILSDAPGFYCEGAFESCEAALPRLFETHPDVVLMDINLPGISGIDGVRRLKTQENEIRVIMLTVYQDDERIFQSICAGALGYLLKRTPKETLLNAIHEVYNGGSPMNAGIARRVIQLFKATASPRSAQTALTPREVDIVHALVDGCSYKMVADREHISIETVRNHIKSIYTKLQVHSKSEAVAKVLKERIV
jgi:DNA-binding NarL/FixJ family response regulator